jgi:hypothetical protein
MTMADGLKRKPPIAAMVNFIIASQMDGVIEE